jgi:hypothetical protein
MIAVLLLPSTVSSKKGGRHIAGRLFSVEMAGIEPASEELDR